MPPLPITLIWVLVHVSDYDGPAGWVPPLGLGQFKGVPLRDSGLVPWQQPPSLGSMEGDLW